MHIYLLIDGSDYSECREEIVAAIELWLTESRSSAVLINNLDDSEDLLGLSIDTNRKLTFKKPLEFLDSLAQQHQQEFVVGLFDDQQQREDICYFGFEEGKPDLLEIASYLGLEK
mgnify:CR=1 FL=1